MRSGSKRMRKSQGTDSGFEDFNNNQNLIVEEEEFFSDEDDDLDEGDFSAGEGEDEEGEEGEGEQEEGVQNDAELEELEKTYMQSHNLEQDILKNLKQRKDEDFLKGQAVKNQRTLWDKSLELRFLLQRAFSSSNRLPKEPVKSSFCKLDKGVEVAYSDMIASSKNTLDSLLELQEALLENNKSIVQASDGYPGGSSKHLESSKILDVHNDEDWSRVAQMHERIAPFRNKSIDKYHRNTQVQTGKGKLQAFNQNISQQVSAYMRDPSRMLNQMQLNRSTVNIFGTVLEEVGSKGEEAKVEGDPELLDDSEFYQQLLKEFFETIDPNSSESAFYALKRLQTKKRKIVDRRASKCRKIRYNIHEPIVNFMPPISEDLHLATPKLVQNIFGLKIDNQRQTALA